MNPQGEKSPVCHSYWKTWGWVGEDTKAIQKSREAGENLERTKKARENRRGEEEERLEERKSKTERTREVKGWGTETDRDK